MFALYKKAIQFFKEKQKTKRHYKAALIISAISSEHCQISIPIASGLMMLIIIYISAPLVPG